jgi:hypothetical protein
MSRLKDGVTYSDFADLKPDSGNILTYCFAGSENPKHRLQSGEL